MSETVNRAKTLERIPLLSNKDLHWLAKKAKQELLQRHIKSRYEYAVAKEGFRGLVNFMTGVTWALACRASLRKSAGHPPIGKRPQSGEMWMPWEILRAARLEVKERQWSPLTSMSAGPVLGNLLIERQRKEPPKHDIAVQFAVRMAPPTYAAVHFAPDRASGAV